GRDAGDLVLVGGALDHAFPAARRGGRMEVAVGVVLQPLVAAEDANQVVDVVVVRLEVVVGDGPVVAESVAGLSLEIVGAETERDASPVIGPAPHHPGAPPVEAGAGGGGERLALDVPAADAGVVLAEWALRRGAAAPVGLPRPGEHRGVGGVVPRPA